MNIMKSIDLTKPPSTTNKAIQFVLGLVAVYIIYLLATTAMKADKLIIDAEKDMSLKKTTYVTNGFVDSSSSIRISTVVPFAPNYLPITPSMNIKGGSQFTYQFWLYVDDTSNIGDKVIFMKGDTNKYSYTLQENKYDVSTKQMVPYNKRFVTDRVAKCPLLAFNTGGKGIEFKLQFNTLNNMNETFYITNMQSESSIYRNNLLSVFAKQWFLVTIVFQDNMPINDFETGLLVKFYLNDVMYQQKGYNTTLKQNDGDLVLFPDQDLAGCKVSTFTYYNYAVSDKDVKQISDKGPVLTPSTTNGAISKNVLYVSDANRLDLWNA